MANFNQVLLMGNVTRDPQLKQLPTQNVAAEFGLACNRRYRTAEGEEREETCFVECTAFGRQAEVIHQYCQKGKPLFVQGRLRYDSWEDKTGAKRSRLTVVVENFQFLGGRDGTGSYPGAAADRDQRDPRDSRDQRDARDGRNPDRQDAPAKFQQSDIPF